MKRLQRVWHAFCGHASLSVDLTVEPWVANCDCGYSLRVRQFALGKIGQPD
jgi:hypothetical protein